MASTMSLVEEISNWAVGDPKNAMFFNVDRSEIGRGLNQILDSAFRFLWCLWTWRDLELLSPSQSHQQIAYQETRGRTTRKLQLNRTIGDFRHSIRRWQHSIKSWTEANGHYLAWTHVIIRDDATTQRISQILLQRPECVVKLHCTVRSCTAKRKATMLPEQHQLKHCRDHCMHLIPGALLDIISRS